MKNNIYDYEQNELKELLILAGRQKFLAKQIFDWLYKKQVTSFTEMVNISALNIEWLNANFIIPDLKQIFKIESKDGTIKFLLALADNNKIETVCMNFNYGYSICVTTQIGCNMGCRFCASGQLKKVRDLTAAEIIAQVMHVNRFLVSKNLGTLRNVVVMGIGEPFDNYKNLTKFLNIVRDQNGINIGSRKITVSTCGIIPKIKEFAIDFPQVGLAISLHAPNDELRSLLMPINNNYKIDDLLAELVIYSELTNRRITFEYLLLKDINDSEECAHKLAKKLRGLLCYINLIPYNLVDGNEFKRSNKIKQFFNILKQEGVMATIRLEKGSDIDGACGQLRAQNEKVKNEI